tara:strand:+ start:1400 stop:2335 length:936 start_codon:yes stop_codon:yes gene_type:complete
MKRFRTGFGRLDRDSLNKLMRAESQVSHLPQPAIHFRPKHYGPIVCKVTDSQYQETGQDTDKRLFTYHVKEIEVTRVSTDGLQWAEVTDGFSWTEVHNLAEMGNTTSQSSGISHSDLPGDFELKAIPVGTVVDVFLAPCADPGNTDPTAGHVFAWFSRPGEFDGACESSSLSSETVHDTYNLAGNEWEWSSVRNWWNNLDGGTWTSTGTTTGTYLKLDAGSRITGSYIQFSADDPGSFPTGSQVRLTVTPSTGGAKTTIQGTSSAQGDSRWTWVDSSGSTVTFSNSEIEDGGTFGWDASDSLKIEIFTPGS